MINGGMQLAIGVDIDSVQVYTSKVASGRTVDYAVWVQHWQQLEHKVVSQYFRIQTRPCQVVDDALHHPACSTLSRMHTARYHDTLPGLDGVWV